MKKYLIEFTGTFFLVLVIGLSGNPLAIGSVLVALVYMGGHISGAHYNPAVTLAVIIRKRIEIREGLVYMIVQVLGAMAAAVCILLLLGEERRFVPAPDMNIHVLKPLFIETLFTFALASVVLNVATVERTAGNSYYGLAIGFTVLAAAIAGGPVSGGAYNPAVGLGPILIDTFSGGNSMGHAWLYIAGPFLGAILAAFFFRYVNADQM